MDVALKIMESLEKHGLNQFSLQESQDGQMNLILNERQSIRILVKNQVMCFWKPLAFSNHFIY